MVGLVLIVMVYDCHVPWMLHPQTRAHGTGPLGLLGNKGGVAFWAEFYGTPICIIGCHLAPHQNKRRKRDQNFHTLKRELIFFSSITDSAVYPMDAKRLGGHLLWLGDMNYRLDYESEMDECYRLIEAADWDTLCGRDQLTRSMREGTAFAASHGFEEAGDLNFSPT